MAGEQRFYSTDDAAANLAVSRSWIYTEIRRGRIESVKLGKRRLITADALDAYRDLVVKETRQAS